MDRLAGNESQQPIILRQHSEKWPSFKPYHGESKSTHQMLGGGLSQYSQGFYPSQLVQDVSIHSISSHQLTRILTGAPGLDVRQVPCQDWWEGSHLILRVISKACDPAASSEEELVPRQGDEPQADLPKVTARRPF